MPQVRITNVDVQEGIKVITPAGVKSVPIDDRGRTFDLQKGERLKVVLESDAEAEIAAGATAPADAKPSKPKKKAAPKKKAPAKTAKKKKK